MTIEIAGYNFEGPFSNTSLLENRSGVYAIIGNNGQGNFLVDLGESAEVKNRVDNHDRKDCWKRKSLRINIAVKYTPNLAQSGRMQIEQFIRSKFSGLCGER